MKDPNEAGCPTPWTINKRHDESIHINDATGKVIYDDRGQDEGAPARFPRAVLEWLVNMVNTLAPKPDDGRRERGTEPVS